MDNDIISAMLGVPQQVPSVPMKIDTTATPGAEGNRLWAEMFASPLVQDTVARLVQQKSPPPAFATKGQAGMISNVMGHFLPTENRVEVEAELPKAVEVGMLVGQQDEDPRNVMRGVLLHEIGHALGFDRPEGGLLKSYEVPTGEESRADIFRAAIGALGPGERDPEALTKTTLGLENKRRREMREGGFRTQSRYTRPLESPQDTAAARSIIQRLLEVFPGGS